MSQRGTTVHLIRHGNHSLGEHVLAGRSDIGLSGIGRAQAHTLAAQHWVGDLSAIYASPSRRTQETAAILSANAVLSVHTAEALNEIDFGYWSGRLIAELDDDPWWRLWNARRQSARTPGGETMAGVQARACTCVNDIARHWPGASVAVVTHAEIIRAVLMSARRMPLSSWAGIPVPTASVHTIKVDPSDTAAREREERPAL